MSTGLETLDEVMSGMGRTGTLFACDQDGVAPDLVIIDGTRGDHVLVAPPFIVEPEHIDRIAQRLRHAVDAATAFA